MNRIAEFVDDIRMLVGKREARLSVPAESAVITDSSSIGGLSSLYSDDGIPISAYKEMIAREPQLKAGLNLKKNARVSSGWTIEPASDAPLDREIAEFVSDQLDAMAGTMSNVLLTSMDAMAYKLSVQEIVYRNIEHGRWAGKFGLKAIKPKKAESFQIKIDDYGNILALQQRQRGLANWKDLDPAAFLIWAWDHDGDYVGKSDLRAAHRWYKAKDHLARFWNIFLERFAAPTVIAKHPKGALKTLIQKMVRFLSKLHIMKAAAIPVEWELELLEAKREGGDYKTAIIYCDRMMLRSLLVPQLILDEGESGSYSLGKSHNNSFLWVLDSLGTEIEEELIGEQLIKRLVNWNYQVDAYPKFKFKAFSAENLESLANAMSDLVTAEIVSPDEPIVREILGLPVAKRKADAKPAPKEPGGNGPKDPEDQEDGADFAQHERPFKVSGLKHCKKCDFKQIAKNLDGREAITKAEMAVAVKDMHQAMLKTVKSQKIVENKNEKAVADLRIKGAAVRKFQSALETGLGYAVQFGSGDALAEVNRGLVGAGGQALKDLTATAGNNFSAQDFDFSMQEVLEHWDSKVPVPKKLLREYSRRAFTITGDVREALLRRAKEVIRKGIIRAATYATIEQALNDVFEPYYMTEVDPIVGTSARLHNIVRTNMSEAYNTGRMNLYKHPDVADFVRAFEYSAVMDDRTTEFCREWHGAVLKKDDTRWGQVLPPNHYQCRSVLIPVVQGEAYDVTKNAPGVQPADGFKL